jgi:hypothetical protein
LTATGYRNALNAYRSDPSSGSLRVAFLVIASIYNITEAAFKVMHPVWILFLFAATAVPQSQLQAHRQKESARAGDAEGEESEQFFSGSRLPSPAPWARTSVDQRPHVASGADRLRTPPGELDAEDA